MSLFLTNTIPSVAFIPQFNIGEIERKAKEAIKTVSDGAEVLIQNTEDDIKAIFDSTSQCLEEIDKIRARITHRAIEYHTLVVRTLVDVQLLPVQLIEEVWQIVAPELIKDPNPRLFQLHNPRAAVWGSQTPKLDEVNDSSVFKPEQTTFFFIHGKDYLGDQYDAYNYMFVPFEREVKLFNEASNYCKDEECAVFLMAYDTKLTDEYETIIRKGFETVLGGAVTGNAPTLILTVLWRELERRAKLAGDLLYSLLSPLPRGGDTPYFLFSHSLGCLASAHMANRIYSEHPGDGGLFRIWFCMAAALPANAFARTGIFPYAPLIANFGGDSRTEVYYSFIDDILSTAYLIANNHLAMGNVGAGVVRPELWIANNDTTLLSREVHTITGGYFSRIGHLIRDVFGIHH